MFFLVLVAVPWLRQGDRKKASAFFSATGKRFRTIGWWCFSALAITGTFNLWVRGVRFSSFADPIWIQSQYGRVVIAKLMVFFVVLCASLFHDFVLGPRATKAGLADPTSAHSERFRKQASWLGRLNVLLALVLIMLGIMIVRGCPT